MLRTLAALVGLALLPGCLTVSQSVIEPIEIVPFTDPATVQVVKLQVEEGVEVEGWLFWKGSPRTLLVFHGTSGNLYWYIEWFNRLYAGLDANLFAIDYRGYGRSTGESNEAGLFKDAEASFDYLVNEKKVDPQSIFIYGFSLGGGPAFHLAGQRKSGGLIVEGTFTSMADAVNAVAEKMSFEAVIELESQFDNLTRAKTYQGRLLVMHSETDEVVPFDQGQGLFEASPSSQKKLVKLAGPHCKPWEADEAAWLREFKTFLGATQ